MGPRAVQRTAHLLTRLDRWHRRATLRRTTRRVYMTAALDHCPSHITHTSPLPTATAPQLPDPPPSLLPAGIKGTVPVAPIVPSLIDALRANRLGFLHERRFR